jgi:hypothetical protein
MQELNKLADLIKTRNSIEVEISSITGRPALIGHTGEYIAAEIFNIQLEESASQKAYDGFFTEGLLEGKSVNIKWYSKHESMLDITPDVMPDYYLVMAGPRESASGSRSKTRPWLITSVYLFDSVALKHRLDEYGVKIGIATSVRRELWEEADIYPRRKNSIFALTEEQWEAISMFG